jgi:hypothetical protein
MIARKIPVVEDERLIAADGFQPMSAENSGTRLFGCKRRKTRGRSLAGPVACYARMKS